MRSGLTFPDVRLESDHPAESAGQLEKRKMFSLNQRPVAFLFRSSINKKLQ